MVQITGMTGTAQASQFSLPKMDGYSLDDKYYVPDCVK
jgi:hypothetical protein